MEAAARAVAAKDKAIAAKEQPPIENDSSYDSLDEVLKRRRGKCFKSAT